MMPKPMSFKGFDLQADPYRVSDYGELFNGPSVDVTSYELARSDGAVDVFKRLKGRSFTLTGYIKATSAANLEAAFDQIKLAMLEQQGDLATAYAGSTRYYNALCQNIGITRNASDISQSVWSAQFWMAQPFATDNVTRNLITALTGQTAGSLNLSAINNGTYLANPYIQITLTALEPNTSDVSITIGNPATNQNITITDQFADGDVLTIDTLNKQIFNGSTLLPGVGNFPDFLPGSGLLSYSDTATSRTIDISATYEARYL